MIDPDKIIRVRPMLYSQEDMEDFKIKINELMQMNLIKQSKSPHSSPAFMVRKHNQIKRGKARMVMNYKEVNKNTKFNGYYVTPRSRGSVDNPSTCGIPVSHIMRPIHE